MERKLSGADGQQALRDHVVQRAADARLRYGMLIDADTIMKIINDRAVVRYPMGVRFDSGPLRPGEFAALEAIGEHPAEGYCLFVHPRFQGEPESWPLVIAYYIPSVNYGDIASHVEAELFGATLLGLEVDDYYNTLCVFADSLGKGQE